MQPPVLLEWNFGRKCQQVMRIQEILITNFLKNEKKNCEEERNFVKTKFIFTCWKKQIKRGLELYLHRQDSS